MWIFSNLPVDKTGCSIGSSIYAREHTLKVIDMSNKLGISVVYNNSLLATGHIQRRLNNV